MNRSDEFPVETFVYLILLIIGLIVWFIFDRPVENEAKKNLYVLYTETCGHSGRGEMNIKTFNKLNENEKLELILSCKKNES